MVLSHYEVTQARYVNGTCQNERKIRESRKLGLRAISFLEQVTLHRDVQNSTHILISSYNKHHSVEYKLTALISSPQHPRRRRAEILKVCTFPLRFLSSPIVALGYAILSNTKLS
jgi:hypothetical protein